MLADLKKLKLKLKEEMTAIESDFEPDGIIWRLGNHGKPKILWRRSGSIRTRPTPVGPPDGGGPRCGLPPNRHRLKSSWYDYAARLPACVPASDRSAYRRPPRHVPRYSRRCGRSPSRFPARRLLTRYRRARRRALK